MIYGLLGPEKSGELVVSPDLIRAGDESYSDYMWHFGIVVGFGNFLVSHGFVGIAQALIYLAATAAMVAVVSRCSYSLIERPLMTAAFIRPSQPASRIA